MPPILIAFFIALTAATVPPVVGGLTAGKDKSTRPKRGKVEAPAFRTWTSYPWIAVANRDTRTCDVVFFALTTGSPVRLLVGGEEQPLDTAWSLYRTLKAGERRTIAFEFLDPRGGKRLACHEEALTCYSQQAGAPDTEVREGQCWKGAQLKPRKGGPRVFGGHTKAFHMFDPTVGGVYADVYFDITGDVGEDWYCPRLEVRWPDGTVSTSESDCPPYEERNPEERTSWPPFNHGFPAGTHNVTACISKAGKQLACTSVQVRVVGGE